MPHLTVEYTGNLGAQADIPALLRKANAVLIAQGGVFPTGDIRSRAIRLDDYVIADGKADDAVVNVPVKMGAGRSAEFKQAFFTDLFEQIKAHFAELYARRYLALSLYVEEADEAGSFKHNNIHKRFKKD